MYSQQRLPDELILEILSLAADALLVHEEHNEHWTSGYESANLAGLSPYYDPFKMPKILQAYRTWICNAMTLKRGYAAILQKQLFRHLHLSLTRESSASAVFEPYNMYFTFNRSPLCRYARELSITAEEYWPQEGEAEAWDERLAKLVQKMPQLVRFKLIQCDPLDWHELREALSSSITDLLIDYSEIELRDLLTRYYFEAFPKLKDLELRGIPIGLDEFDEPYDPPALRLVSLRLEECQRSLSIVLSVLENSRGYLKHLIIHTMDIDDDHTFADYQDSIVDAAGGAFPSLVTFRLHRIDPITFDEDAAPKRQVVDFLQTFPNLEVLDCSLLWASHYELARPNAVLAKGRLHTLRCSTTDHISNQKWRSAFLNGAVRHMPRLCLSIRTIWRSSDKAQFEKYRNRLQDLDSWLKQAANELRDEDGMARDWNAKPYFCMDAMGPINSQLNPHQTQLAW